MSHATHDRPWVALNLLGSRLAAQRLHRQRFWLALAIPQCLGIFGLLAMRAVLPSPAPRPMVLEVSPAQRDDDAAWLQHWQANRAQSAELLALLADKTPAGVMLTSLQQEDGQLTLTGRVNRAEALPQFELTLTSHSGYRHLRHKETSAGLHQMRPVQHFVLTLSHADADVDAPRQEPTP